MEQTASVKQSNETDRVSFSFGMKLSLPTKYESADFHISLSSNVEPNETLEQAFARIKSTVQKFAATAYNEIRQAESGLPEEAKVEAAEVKHIEAKPKTKTKDIKVLRQQIKSAFAVLESQKKVNKTEFKQNLLFNKKVDDLSDTEVSESISKIKSQFPELGL